MIGGAGASGQSEAGTAATAGAGGAPVEGTGAGEVVRRLAVAELRPCPLQPRKDFSAEALQELADSIKEQGIVQPLIARRQGDHFELIAGERRWRAAQMAGLKEVPVIVRQVDDRSVLELALIENLQRENLNAIEEAQGYAQLIGQFSLTQEQAAAKVGKSRVVIANALRLLKLAPELQVFLREGRISVGHAKVLLGLTSQDEQRLAAQQVLKRALSVRQTEELVATWLKGAGENKTAKAAPTDAHLASLQERLQQRFGTKVSLRYHQGKGTVEIKFYSDDDLERFLKLAGIDPE